MVFAESPHWQPIGYEGLSHIAVQLLSTCCSVVVQCLTEQQLNKNRTRTGQENENERRSQGVIVKQDWRGI